MTKSYGGFYSQDRPGYERRNARSDSSITAFCRSAHLSTAGSVGISNSFSTVIGVTEEFSAVVTADSIANGKPDPEIFVIAANQLSPGSNEYIVFEDARAGAKTAKAGGFPCVGIDS